MATRTPLKARKYPRQRRSQLTVDAILGATARVLSQEGYDGLTTNRVAEVAGVSIGSLYQYFPNKQALLHAIWRRHAEQMLDLLASTLGGNAEAPLREAVRAYVRAMIRAHGADPDLHREMVPQVVRHGLHQFEELNERALALISGYLERHRSLLLPRDLDLAAFMLLTMVEAAVHMALLRRPDDVASGALEREVVAVVLRYLLGSHDAGDG